MVRVLSNGGHGLGYGYGYGYDGLVATSRPESAARNRLVSRR